MGLKLIEALRTFTLVPEPEPSLHEKLKDNPRFAQFYQNISPEQKDAQALASDWQKIGNDLYVTLDKLSPINH